MSGDEKLGRISNKPKKNSYLYAMKTLLATCVAFLHLCSCDSLMERNTIASREYHDER
jgi:hypothetical protein